MEIQIPKKVRILGYPAWFFFIFFLSLYLTFPMNAVRDQVVTALETALGKGQQGKHGTEPVVEIGEMSLWRLSGVSMNRVALQLGSRNPDPGPRLELDELNLRVGIFSLLFGSPTINFSGEIWEGDLSGSVELASAKKKPRFLENTRALFKGQANVVREFELEIDDLDFSKSPFVMEKAGVPVEGELNVEIDLVLGKDPGKEGTGMIDIKATGIKLGPGELEIPVPGLTGGLTVPVIDLGDFTAKAEMKKGAGKFEKLALVGKDFEASIDAEVTAAKKLRATKLRGNGWFQIKSGFLEKNAKFKSILELAPQLQRAKNGDDQFEFKISGNIAKPKFNLGKSRKRTPRTPRATPNRNKRPNSRAKRPKPTPTPRVRPTRVPPAIEEPVERPPEPEPPAEEPVSEPEQLPLEEDLEPLDEPEDLGAEGDEEAPLEE